MTRYGLLVLMLYHSLAAFCQQGFITLLPQQPVIAGEAFQVQFVIADAKKVSDFTPPRFEPFRVVSGPNIYTGYSSTGKEVIRNRNYVYTLVTDKTGVFAIKGATIVNDGKLQTSNDVAVKVTIRKDTQQREDGITGVNELFLRPGENIEEKIRTNIFLQAEVNRKECMVGEPVVATFRLYSRLRSKSELVKNPGFYGFSVFDMHNLEDRLKKTEKVNGKLFDMHLLRKVQLYPTQAGKFTIDGMVLSNKITFSRRRQIKNPNGEVVEQMLGGDKDDGDLSADEEQIETILTSAPFHVSVKPLPASGPESFDGAVGQFRVNIATEKSKLARNEQGFLQVEIKGKGNFIQLTAPRITWPSGIEGFDATVKDNFEKKSVPLSGSRIFRYGFVATQPGRYIIPAIRFSYFNPDSNRFISLITDPVQVTFTEEVLKADYITGNPANRKSKKPWWTIGLLILLITGIAAAWIYLRKRNKKADNRVQVKQQTDDPNDDLLFLAKRSLRRNDPAFFRELALACQEFLQKRYGVSGPGLNKNSLLKSTVNEPEKKLLAGWIQVIESCEAVMYTGVENTTNKEALLQQAGDLLVKWQALDA